jgi:hypothetical protein
MSLIKHDARAAVPSEYSDSDPRNPHQLTEQSQANLDQMTADSAFDDAPRKRVLKEGFEVMGASQTMSVALASVSILALMGLVLLGRIGWPIPRSL